MLQDHSELLNISFNRRGQRSTACGPQVVILQISYRNHSASSHDFLRIGRAIRHSDQSPIVTRRRPEVS